MHSGEGRNFYSKTVASGEETDESRMKAKLETTDEHDMQTEEKTRPQSSMVGPSFKTLSHVSSNKAKINQNLNKIIDIASKREEGIS